MRKPTWPIEAVHIWEIELEQPPRIVAQLESLLFDDERERAAHFYFERDRRRFTVARGALRRILAGYAGSAPAALRFEYGAHGKPALREPPILRSLHFNLSHSHELALLGVVATRLIGIDLEYVSQLIDLEGLATSFFAPEECAALLSQPPNARPLTFFRHWAAKEAYMKGRGEGMALRSQSFSVTFGADHSSALLRPAPGDPQPWTLQPLNRWPGYGAALAMTGPPLPIHNLCFSPLLEVHSDGSRPG